ncbi:hypothetical protein JD292_02055 [Leucobacter sp. CSA2]|uniref:DNA polymerase III subunit gamma/tau n=1 Tax=Leucobacter edaphi TaxID=2796472 RepID=A0A934QAM2_9MICO|nr:hypothetical protein [Leucobacter edaphi]MBK0420863.1 hypothetical protein [Leucobacter edaphi]
MRKNTSRGARESAIASGWTVQGDPSADSAAPEPAGTAAAGSEPSAAIAEGAGVGSEQPTVAAAPSGSDASANGEAAGPGGTETEGAEPGERVSNQFSNVALVVLGVLGGLYLLYAWVWLSWAQYYASVNQEVASASGSLGGVLQQIVFWAAPLAPILWFVSVLALNRGASTLKHAVWLLIGAIVLFPLPLLSGGAS